MNRRETPPESLEVRSYRAAKDEEALRRCFSVLQTHEASLDPDLRPAGEIADAYLAHLFQECAAHSGRVFVAVWRNRVVGYVAVMAEVLPDPLDSHPNPYAYLHDLVVLEEARGIGAGRALMESAENYARERGASRMRLHVLAGNEAALRLYEDRGYRGYELLLEKPLDARVSENTKPR